MVNDKPSLISAKDMPVMERLVRDYMAGRLGFRPDLIGRRKPTGGGGESRRYATVTRSLRRPDPTTAPPTEAWSCYKIKLASEAAFAAWSASHGLYESGDKAIWTDGLDYICLTDHTASEAKSPANPSYWSVYSPDAYILGYPYTDLIGTVPWFEVGADVEVVVRDSIYYIHGTVSRCEEIDDDELFTSIQWNAEEKRAMAVYR